MRKIHFYLLSIFSGILLSLPWIIPGSGWVLLFAFVPMLLAGNQQESPGGKLPYLHFFSAFLIWNVLSIWWIAYVSVAGMLFIATANAAFMSLVWWGSNRIRTCLGEIPGYFLLVVFWITFEFLNHHWALPWPWLTLGNGLANCVRVIQWYEFTGAFGGSLWILLANIFVFLTIRFLTVHAFLKSAKLAGLALFVIAFPIAISLYLYGHYSGKGDVQNVVVLQPNIDPYTEKFSGMSEEEQVGRLVSLTESKISGSTNLVLAPETALLPLWEDSLVSQDSSLLSFRQITKRFPKISFVFGAISQRRFRDGEPISTTARRSINGRYYFDSFNSALLFNSESSVQFGHKNILVAGVEKHPFQEYFTFLPDVMLDLGGVKGSLALDGEPKVLESSLGLKIGPVICFESVFGHHVRKLVQNGAQCIVVLTNDGWWKNAPGIWQHFGYSRIRAIETRRNVAQSANTGISGCIDSRGDVTTKTNGGVACAINCQIRTNNEITFYVKYGDYLSRICLVLTGLMVAFYCWVKWKDKKNPH